MEYLQKKTVPNDMPVLFGTIHFRIVPDNLDYGTRWTPQSKSQKMSEFFLRLHIFWANFRLFNHIFRTQETGMPRRGLFPCLCGAVSELLSAAKNARHQSQSRSEALLIYRISSHTNPKRRKRCLKQTGRKSSKEEPQECRKAPKRAQQGFLKV